MLGAINVMLLDMLAAIAREGYTDRWRRQAEGIAKAKAEKRLTGRVEDRDRNATIEAMLAKGLSWGQIQTAAKCSRPNRQAREAGSGRAAGRARMTLAEAVASNRGVLAVLDIAERSASAATFTSKRPIAEGFAAAALTERAEAGLELLIVDEAGQPIVQRAGEDQP